MTLRNAINGTIGIPCRKGMTRILLCITALSFAQKKITKQLDSFTEVKVYEGLQVELIPSNENKIFIYGPHRDHVITKVIRNTLKIRMNLPNKFKGDKVRIVLHYTKIYSIDTNEGAVVFAKHPFTQLDLSLDAQEGSEIRVNAHVKRLKITVSSGGKITCQGKSDRQTIKISTGGRYYGYKTKTINSEIGITTGGKAEINASGEVVAKVSMGGNVYIKGNPKSIEKSIFLGGVIKKID